MQVMINRKLTSQEKAKWRKILKERQFKPYDRRYKANREQEDFENECIIYTDDIEAYERQALCDHRVRPGDPDTQDWGAGDWLLQALYDGEEPVERK